MIGYAERVWVPARTAEVFRYARSLVARVPSHLDPEGREVRCHELARAVARCLAGQRVAHQVVDGLLWAVDHTWIVLPDPGRRLLLDMYAPGRLPQVQLICDDACVSRGYTPGEERTDVRWSVVDHLVRAMTALSTDLILFASSG